MLDDFAGQVLDEKYRVDRKLGEGGMGAVYLATHVGTTRPVALKLIAPRLVTSDEFLERFRREAEAAGRLRHPNVVNVTDFGLTTVDDGRTAYLVMEYLDGESLRALLLREPAPPVEFVVDVIEQAALAVDEAHRHGIVHRDLKPDNIWLQPDGRGGFNVKVLDFGLAKIRVDDAEPEDPAEHAAAAGTQFLAAEPWASDTATTLAYGSDGGDAATSGELTRVGSVLGTPAYMSPEQCVGEVAGSRSDVYSLAVIAYEMLAGELPFKGTALAVMAQHAGTSPPPLVAQRAASGIAEIVARGMAKDPEDRPTTATAFAAALRARTVTGGQVLRRAVALYSEHFPAFIRLSLFGNLPLLAIGMALLLTLPWVRVGAWQAALFLGCMMLGVLYPYAANRATFAVALERLRKRPLSRLDAGEVLDDLAARLGGDATSSRAWLAARLLAFAPRSAQLALAAAIPAEVVERLGRREANERSRRLMASVPEALRTVALFGMVCYAVPTALFFLATLGVTQALGLDLAAATSVSFAVAIGVMGLNVVWLITPAHIALGSDGPESGVVGDGREGAQVHAVDADDAGEVVDLVLKDAGVPAARLDRDRLGPLVQTLDPNRPRAGDEPDEPGEAQTPFEELDRVVPLDRQARVDDHVKGDRTALPLGDRLGRSARGVLGPVLDHRELDREADLRRREPHTRRGPHRVAHVGDELLDLRAEDLLARELSRALPERRVADLNDLERHRSPLTTVLSTTSPLST